MADLTPVQQAVYDYLVEEGDGWADQMEVYMPADPAGLCDHVGRRDLDRTLGELDRLGLVTYRYGGPVRLLVLPGGGTPCPVCHRGEVGYDTDADDGRGALICNFCQATDAGGVIRG